MLKTYVVFNLEQIENIEVVSDELTEDVDTLDEVESFLHATGADIRYGGQKRILGRLQMKSLSLIDIVFRNSRSLCHSLT
ncbi:hypothetical protein [Photobacterium leiognathi]|uniref:hypothetical protein n=1 Tax=Photobacterium leiognathi TaxID=553611 RepID=UPI0027394DAD|nr:hypothetical protein [Photobacterium leiognathi]